jgi:AcrR family transcriptional regulator
MSTGEKAVAAPGRGARTRKYLDRQEAILGVAVQMLNRSGLKSMTLAEVAEHFGLVATGVAYYFRTKESLAAACFLRSIEAHERVIAEASSGATVEDRLHRLVGGYFDLLARIALGEADDVALFEDIRSLNDAGLEQAYVEMFRRLRTLVEGASGDRAAANARTHYLLQQLVWARYWLARYDPEDYPRAAERMADILLNGLDAGAQAWSPPPLPLAEREAGETDAREVFLRAATQLINEQGYRGASVVRIAARLDVT